MIGNIKQKFRQLFDNQIALHAQRMLDKHLEKLDKEAKPYCTTRIGFGASFGKDGK